MRYVTNTLFVLLGLSVSLYAAAPVVSNVTTEILSGRRVRITYDVSDADGEKVSIFVRASADGGNTFDVPVRTVSGAVSPTDFITDPASAPPMPSITPGNGKQIVWDALADWPQEVSGNAVVEVIARDGDPSAVVDELAPGVNMKFIWIRPGTFNMGSNAGDSDVNPIHSVTLTQGFYLAETELTEAQYEAIIAGGATSNLPQASISWDDVQDYIVALHAATGTNDLYALPTEAQWEYACRAGTTTDWSFGSDENLLGDYAWNCINSGDRRHPVGEKLANPWGLFDMHGNIYEWVQDYYSDMYYSVSPSLDPLGPDTGFYRVRRGGDFTASPHITRSADRSYYSLGNRYSNFGARLLRKAP